MNFKKTMCAAIVLTIALSLMLPATVLALKDNAPHLPPYANDLLYKGYLMKAYVIHGIHAKTVVESASSKWWMYQGNQVIELSA